MFISRSMMKVPLMYKQKNWKSILQKEPVPGAEHQIFMSGHCKPFGNSDELFHHVFPSDGENSLFARNEQVQIWHHLQHGV